MCGPAWLSRPPPALCAGGLDFTGTRHMNPTPALDCAMTADRLALAAGGPWTAAHADVLERLIDAAAPQVAEAERISLDMAGVEALDTIGAWLLERLMRRSKRDGKRAEFTGLPPRYRGLIAEMHAVNLQPRTPPKARTDYGPHSTASVAPRPD